MEKACMKYNNKNTEKVGLMSFTYDKVAASWLRREYFDEIIYSKFEFIEVPIPKRYHEMLVDDYGDYMVFNKGNSHHGEMIVDTKKSYKEYI